MKIIYPDNITSVSADEENANFLAVNVQTDYIKEVWKATSVDAVLTLVVSSGKGAALFGCNASSVSVTILTGLDGAWAAAGDGNIGGAWGATGDGHIGVSWAVSEFSEVTTTYDLNETGLGALWIDYTEMSIQHTIKIELTGSATIEVGVAKAGAIKEFNDPQYGITEGLRDYSLIKELSNGAMYVKKRDVVRTFGLNFFVTRDDDFYDFMDVIYRQNGSNPLAYRLSSALTDFQWIVYARPDAMPSGSHDYPEDSIVGISITEVI